MEAMGASTAGELTASTTTQAGITVEPQKIAGGGKKALNFSNPVCVFVLEVSMKRCFRTGFQWRWLCDDISQKRCSSVEMWSETWRGTKKKKKNPQLQPLYTRA